MPDTSDTVPCKRTGRSRPGFDFLTGHAKVSMLLFAFLVASNIAVGFAECGVGPCQDNPTGYWLFGTGKMRD